MKCQPRSLLRASSAQWDRVEPGHSTASLPQTQSRAAARARFVGKALAGYQHDGYDGHQFSAAVPVSTSPVAKSLEMPLIFVVCERR